MGKGEIARNEQFLLFPQCFQKLSVVDVLKRVSVEERVKPEQIKQSNDQSINQN